MVAESPTHQVKTTGHAKRRRELLQVIAIQDLTAKRIQDEGLTLETRELADLVRAYDLLSERRRILKMKPLPGSLRPDQPNNRKSRLVRLGPVIDVSPIPQAITDQPKESLSPNP